MGKKRIGLFIFIIISIVVIIAIQWDSEGDLKQKVDHQQEVTEEIELISIDVLNAHLTELTSEGKSGRFPGTPGNVEAGAYIRDSMIQSGLKSPGFADDYRMLFSAIIPMKGAKTTLTLETETEKVEFEFGRDYVEFVTRNFAMGEGNYSGPFKIIDDPLNLYDFDDAEIIVYTLEAIKDINYDSLFNQILLAKNKPKMVLYESNQQNSGYFVLSPYSRMVSQNDNEGGILIYKISDSVVSQLIAHSTGILHASTSVKIESVEMANIIGMIDGTGETGYVLTAHFDHLAINFDGTYNPGALDNASGVATLLALSQSLIKYGNPELDYYFIAFNAEEAGLYGSEAFAAKLPLPLEGFEFINIDMVGSSSVIPVTVSSTMPQSHALQSRVIEQAQTFEIETLMSDSGSSDHVPIEHAGYRAVSLTELDKRYYHSPNDTIENSIDYHRMRQIALFIYNLVTQ